jgi:hypothetical protein
MNEINDNENLHYRTKILFLYRDQIKNNPSLPDEDKKELMDLVCKHFMLIDQMIGTFELMYLREKQSR